MSRPNRSSDRRRRPMRPYALAPRGTHHLLLPRRRRFSRCIKQGCCLLRVVAPCPPAFLPASRAPALPLPRNDSEAHELSAMGDNVADRPALQFSARPRRACAWPSMCDVAWTRLLLRLVSRSLSASASRA